MATSYVSVEQARLNLQREVGGKSCEKLMAENSAKWNDLLGRIVITDTEEKKRTFYSCLYRCFLFPRVFHEYGTDGQPIHYSTRLGEIVPGVMYTDNGFWDTCRTLYPLLTMLVPDKVQEMVQGYLNFYCEEGWLPKWLSPGERGIMPGTLVDAVLADAAVKGLLTREQMELALEAMLKHANTPGDSHLHGCVGVTDYVQLGYVPCDKYRESANNTLDAAYCDWCIAQVADRLGKTDIREEYLRRSRNYRNLFDPAVGFLRGRNTNGSFPPDFSPVRWGGEYCEGAAWQNAFGVYHDIDGLANLYGGRDGLLAKLDELFATPPEYEVGTYKAEIHEMTEMAAANFGQCAISNQPSFHLPYLYTALGQPQKTAYWVNRIVNEAFTPDAYPGDEDNGSMAAWYVWSVLGMYPLCPGKNEFVQGACQVQRAELRLPDGGINVICKEENE
jgi:predicted alpha-1,2-mannosidase